ncbi:MAG: hypothetical protein JXA99_05425 [Candidatus Lokiarchaeota archaeon]|nr:hypothetical protein [Candidatus Lokiarchaeota archaeon]
MFNIEDFQNYSIIIPIIKKINKYLEKGKHSNISPQIEELKRYLDHDTLSVPITYIFSVLAENYPELFNLELIDKIEPLVYSDNIKLKLNSISILGFFILNNPELIDIKYFSLFTKLLNTEKKDIRENCYYFLQRMFNIDQRKLLKFMDNLLEALELEILDSKLEDIIIILNFIQNCDNFNFKQLYTLRKLSKSIITEIYDDSDSDLKSILNNLLKNKYQELIGVNFEDINNNDLLSLINKTFIQLKYEFNNDLKKEKQIEFKDYLKKFKKNVLKEKEIYFYFKDQEKQNIYLFELEKEKTIDFFNQNCKLSYQEIINQFQKVLDDSNLQLFVKMLLKLKHISGFLSEFNFYPSNYIITELTNSLKEVGYIELDNYNYLPIDFIIENIKKISNEANYKILVGKEKKTFHVLSKITEKIREIAAKETCINLKTYRDQFTEKSFVKIIKSLPKDYLTSYHKGSSWLTNIGKYKFLKELENSKIIGFFDIEKIKEKLDITEDLIREIFNNEIDIRSGVWNKSQDIFYYSKYIKQKVEDINQIKDPQERVDRINKLSRDLNIEKEKIIGKIDENIELIGEEIKNQDQIRIPEYIEKLGMDYNDFMHYIDSLGLNYLKRADFLIFNPLKIENAKKEITQLIKRDIQTLDFISLDNYDMNSTIIKEILKELQNIEEFKGIVYEMENEKKFYTQIGLKNMMLSNIFLFSFHDFFYGKTLDDNEISILLNLFYDLNKQGRLKGTFNKATLTFSSDEIVFAKDYNSNLDQFRFMVDNYIKKFNSEFKKIKPILNKETAIIPQEIKLIQDAILRINENYIFWKSKLDAYITRVHKKLLEDQGISLKKFNSVSYTGMDKKDIKSFADDIEVKELMDKFNYWISLFNKLELKYQNVIFYQKRYLNNPDDQESNQNLLELRKELNLTQ